MDNDEDSIESSEFDLSVDSSVHSSDYSASTLDDETELFEEPGLKASLRISMDPKEYPGILPTSPAGHSSSSASSPGWRDDTCSSSGESSLPVTFRNSNQSYEIQFDKARNRLKQYEGQKEALRKKSGPRRRPDYLERFDFRCGLERTDSPSSVYTGQGPSKPIDVTGNQRIPVSPSLLEQVRKVRLEKQEKKQWYAQQATGPHRARIVGLAPREPKITNVLSSVTSATGFTGRMPRPNHSIPRMVPTGPPLTENVGEDDISSIGGMLPAYRIMAARGHQIALSRGNLMESGAANTRVVKRGDGSDDDEKASCWSRRTDLELLLLFVVIVAVLALATLVVFVHSGSSI